MKPTLDPAIIALYFNLRAGKQHQLSVQEQIMMKACMERAFPVLLHANQRLIKAMPAPKKEKAIPSTPKRKNFLRAAIVGGLISCILFILFLLSGCENSGYGDPLAMFKYPDMLWRDLVLNPSINYDWYYFLVDEYEAIDQRPPFQFLDGFDFWGA